MIKQGRYGWIFATLSFSVHLSTPKKFRSNEPYNTGDVIESGGNYYIAQNPEKNGQKNLKKVFDPVIPS